MKRSGLVLLMIAFILCVTGCKGVKDIKVTSVELESVSLRGLRGIELLFKAEVDNPARKVEFSEIDGSLIHSGKVIGKLAMDSFSLMPKTSGKYDLKARINMAQGVGLKEFMVLVDPEQLNECTVDVSAKAAYGKGAPLPVKMKNIPLKELLNSIGNEKN